MELIQPKKIYNFDTILTNSELHYGSGGSNNVIMIYKDNVIKMIPNYRKGFNEISFTIIIQYMLIFSSLI